MWTIWKPCLFCLVFSHFLSKYPKIRQICVTSLKNDPLLGENPAWTTYSVWIMSSSPICRTRTELSAVTSTVSPSSVVPTPSTWKKNKLDSGLNMKYLAAQYQYFRVRMHVLVRLVSGMRERVLGLGWILFGILFCWWLDVVILGSWWQFFLFFWGGRRLSSESVCCWLVWEKWDEMSPTPQNDQH